MASHSSPNYWNKYFSLVECLFILLLLQKAQDSIHGLPFSILFSQFGEAEWLAQDEAAGFMVDLEFESSVDPNLTLQALYSYTFFYKTPGWTFHPFIYLPSDKLRCRVDYIV